MNPIYKGNWYYELQIFMIVLMWCHNDDHYNNYLKKMKMTFHIGRLVIWKDSLWLKRPKYRNLGLRLEILYLRFGNVRLKLTNIFLDLVIFLKNIKIYFLKKQLVVLEFIDSLNAYLELNKAGLRIGKWEDDDLPGRYSRYRLFWKDVLIRDIPDIVHVDNDWKLVNNGHVTFMSSDTIRGVKPTSFYEDDLFDDGTYPYIHKEILKNKLGKPKK